MYLLEVFHEQTTYNRDKFINKCIETIEKYNDLKTITLILFAVLVIVSICLIYQIIKKD